MSDYEDYNAIFFALWHSLPVFHGHDWDRRDKPDSNTSFDWTRCGREVASYNRDTGKLTEPGKWIPMKHAVKFGRACKVCFPEQS